MVPGSIFPEPIAHRRPLHVVGDIARETIGLLGAEEQTYGLAHFLLLVIQPLILVQVLG